MMDKHQMEKHKDNMHWMKCEIMEMILEHCDDMRDDYKGEDDEFDVKDLKHLHSLSDLFNELSDVHIALHQMEGDAEYPHKKKKLYTDFTE